MAGLDDFAKKIDRIAVRVEGNLEKAVKNCAEAVARSVISNTPVDTVGRAATGPLSLTPPSRGCFPRGCRARRDRPARRTPQPRSRRRRR